MKESIKTKLTTKGVISRIGFLFAGFILGLLVSLLWSDNDPGDLARGEANAEPTSTSTVWTCSMHPQVRQPEPGLCPLCGMDLIALEKGGDAPGPTEVVLSERAKTLARINTTQVRRQKSAASGLRLLGRIEASETSMKSITAWTGGRIDRLHVKVTGQSVAKGQVIATLYSPEIYAAHQDLIVAKRQVAKMEGSGETTKNAAVRAYEASKSRLRLLGVPDEEIAQMERADKPTKQIAIRTPFAGTVMERVATEGAYVGTGALLYKVADLSSLWVQLDAYEGDLPLIVRGQEVEIQVEGLPDDTFSGKIAFIDPVVDATRRTAQVRVEVSNKGRRLRPGMFVQAEVKTKDAGNVQQPLIIPSTAPLFTGRRAIVFVEEPGAQKPTYNARTVRLGPKTGDVYPVVAGLAEGERVVVKGAFTLDADLQIRGGQSMMAAPDDTAPQRSDPLISLAAGERKKLVPVLEAYLELQKQLAADDLEKARAAGEQLARLSKKTVLSNPQKAVEFWDELKKGVGHQAERLEKSDSMETARGLFETLSRHMISLLERLGNPLDSPVRLAFCPMAFGSKGAQWVQSGEVVDNSYFGHLMRTCGEIQQTIESGAHLLMKEPAAESASEAPAGGHQH